MPAKSPVPISMPISMPIPKTILVPALILGLTLLLSACSEGEPPATPEKAVSETSDPVATATSKTEAADSSAVAADATASAIISEVETWLLDNDLMLRQLQGLPITRLPDTSFAQVEKNARFAQDIVSRISALDPAQLDHQTVLSLQVIQNRFLSLVEAPKHYWQSFAVTTYATLFSSYAVSGVMPGLPLTTAEQRAAYLDLLDDVAASVENQGVKTESQAERGIRIPQAALPGVRTSVSGNKGAVKAMLMPAASRLQGVDNAEAMTFMTAVKERFEERLDPAFDAILAILNEDYAARAPQAVGMSQYPGGEAAYRAAVREATSYDISPEQLHESGLASLAQLQAEMQQIRGELGFTGTADEFHDQLRKNPRFIAKTPADVEDRYMGYIRRIEPLIDDYFRLKPKAPYGVKRLDPAAEPGQTFGYYQMPSAIESRGLYRYNGSSLAERPLVWAQGLIYHELVPGHHFQMALHTEMKDLPPMMKSFFFGIPAYNEGWAEYASGLGKEMGLYDDPYDRYGRLLMESFLANRLVVDTGMNLFGWPLERARQFMRENTFASETEIATETLRYSTDIPAQALGYRFGSDFIWQLRRKKEAELGDAFEVKDFHEAVLNAGTLPMWVLEQHVDWYFANVTKGR